MKGGTAEMKNTRCELCRTLIPPSGDRWDRLCRAMAQELTEKQRRAVTGYYLEGKNLCQLADEQGVHPSTVWRTLNRALTRLHRCLDY